MSNKLKDRLMARTNNLSEKVEAAAAERPSIAEQRPMTMPGQLGAFRLEAQRYQQRIQQLTEQLAEAKGTGSAVEIPLEDLHEVPGRRRYMSSERYTELRENLRHNKLIHPVVVLARADGGFDIQSGHHRVDAYRELGRPTIRCVLGDATAAEATTGAFFANLMQSDLTDYEKYVGLKHFHVEHPDLKQAEVAARSGLSPQQVSDLYAFGRLPEDALALIKADKSIVGAKTVATLAALAEAGNKERVVEAVKLLADRSLDQTGAIKHARASAAPAKPVVAPQTFRVKAGTKTWCDVRRVKNVMRIEFKSEDEAAEVQEAIRLHLEQLAQRSSSQLPDTK
ncbi:ParB/RepB/Spo0J family partition protein [Caballeronia sp. GaOx3]|uniref:ParB/RepB/Spo0J family partition protein n=1 Tax=Caballeronia sp. GaOx3 TaxID=2921740 RepID=UPI0020286B97|nr:ParB N-terminal domain-containing protein [Caballeronia sp. GaOx3]